MAGPAANEVASRPMVMGSKGTLTHRIDGYHFALAEWPVYTGKVFSCKYDNNIQYYLVGGGVGGCWRVILCGTGLPWFLNKKNCIISM